MVNLLESKLSDEDITIPGYEIANQLLNSFLLTLRSENTKKAYKTELINFINFIINNNLNLNKILPIHLDIHLQKTKKNKTNSSKNISISAIKSFMKYLHQNEFINKNRLTSFPLFKTKVENPTKAFKDSDIPKLLNVINEDTIKGNTSRLCLILLFNLGIRRSSLSRIKLSDIIKDRDTTLIKIYTKGDKILHIPLTSYVISEINKYVERYEKLTGNSLKSNDFLLQSSSKIKTKPINESTIYRIIKKYASKIGITYNVSPHSCRSTVICHLLEKGVSHRSVADLVGHSSIRTTQIYDKKRDEYKNSAIFKVNYEG